jgi:hypothetical protein
MQRWRLLIAAVLIPSLSLAQSEIGARPSVVVPTEALVSIPAHWQSCGSANESYVIRSERAVVYNGLASASLASRTRDAPADRFGAFCQATLGEPFRGRRVYFSAYLRTEAVDGGARLWLRADAHGMPVAFDNMGINFIRGTHEWARYTVVVDVPLEADRLFYGVALQGPGELWVDNASFAIDGRALQHPGTFGDNSVGDPTRSWLVPVPTNLDFEGTIEVGN